MTDLRFKSDRPASWSRLIDYILFPFSLFFFFSLEFSNSVWGALWVILHPSFSHPQPQLNNLSEFLNLSKLQFHQLPDGDDSRTHLIGLTLWVKSDDARTSLDIELTPSGFSAWFYLCHHVVQASNSSLGTIYNSLPTSLPHPFMPSPVDSPYCRWGTFVKCKSDCVTLWLKNCSGFHWFLDKGQDL